jgi:hypothetical protein
VASERRGSERRADERGATEDCVTAGLSFDDAK